MKKTTGWVAINREERARIFARIDDHGPVKSPRKDVAKLLVYTILDHAEYIDDPKTNRRRGTWRTSYAEIESLTGYNKRTTMRSLMYLEKQGLITRGNGNGYQEAGIGTKSKKEKGPKQLVINALFYSDLVGAKKQNGYQDQDRMGSLTSKEVPLKSFKENSTSLTADPRTLYGKTPSSHEGSLSYSNSLNSFDSKTGRAKSNGKVKTKETHIPTTTHPATEALASKAGALNAKPKTGKAAKPKNGKLVSRQGFTIDEARLHLHQRGNKGAASLLQLFSKLGVETFYKTHMDMLVLAHGAAAKKADSEYGTWLHTALYELVKEGGKFERLVDVFEGVR
jgi:hypothetical protein